MSSNPITVIPTDAFTTGGIPSAANLLAWIRVNTNSLTSKEKGSASTNGSVSIPNATWTTVTNFTVIGDPFSLWNSGSQYFQLGWGGTYKMHSSATWVANTTGVRGLRIACSGTPIVYCAVQTAVQGTMDGTVMTTYTISADDIPTLAAGTQISLQVYQNSGSSLTLAAAGFVFLWESN